MDKKPKTLLVAIASMLMLQGIAFAQLPTPSYGWNLGNTMEPPCGVGCWSPLPTQALINSVAAAGFNTIRIPCAWNSHTSGGVIDATYLSQVKQVVDWCYAKGLYVIINDHWDNGWFENQTFSSYSSSLNSQLQNLWTQVANYFKSYDSHLLFACANEPNANSAAATTVLFQYYQNWVNYVRATGGNNATRWLIVQGPETNIGNTYNWVTMPNDSAKHLMIEVHEYDPYQFTQLSPDASWGNMFYFWGAAYHVTGTMASRNATSAEESYIDSQMDMMKTKFANAGYPVLIGEWRASPKPSESDLTGQYITQNYNSTTYWNYYVHNACTSRGLFCTCWDISGQLFNWTTGAIVDQTQLNAVLGRSYVGPVPGLGGSGPVANGTYKLIARHSGKAMDANGNGTANGTQIIQWTYGGGNNQRWTVTDRGSGQYSIIGVQSGRCVDISGAGTANGTKVQLWDYLGGSNQKYTFTATSGGYYRLTPTHATGSCLDVNGASTADGALVQLWTYGGGNNQQWAFQAP